MTREETMAKAIEIRAARPKQPKDAEYAAQMIETMERETKSRIARIKMCDMVARFGNYTPEGLAMWAAHRKTFK